MTYPITGARNIQFEPESKKEVPGIRKVLRERKPNIHNGKGMSKG